MDNSEEIEVSVISIVYNDVSGITLALESAVSQKNVNLEIIVIDGASTDGTPSKAREILKDFKCSTVISEKDTGIYNAINKGIKIARGKYVLMLNAGDWFYDDHSLSFLLKDAENGNKRVSLGRCIYYYPHKNEKVEDSPSLPPSGAPEFSHQALLYKRSLHNEIGYYNEKMKSAADYDFFCRLKFLGGIDFVKKNRFIVVRGKYGNDASDKLLHSVEMAFVDIKNGLILKTWPKRIKSILSRTLNFFR